MGNTNTTLGQPEETPFAQVTETATPQPASTDEREDLAGHADIIRETIVGQHAKG